MKNLSQNFGKTALCGVVGSERKIRGFGTLPNKQKCRRILRKRVPLSYACYATFHSIKLRKDGKGMERKRIIKNGHIVVKNPLYQELPKREVVIKSGRTSYRFTGSYDGQKAACRSKVLRLMEQENLQKEVDKKDGSR